MHLAGIIALACAFSCVAETALAATYDVSDEAQLSAALERLGPGDVVQMAPGVYGAIALTGVHLSAPATIRGTNPSVRPVIAAIDLHDVSGIVFSNLEIVYGATQAPSSTYAVYVFNGSDIVFDQMEILSAPDGVIGNDAEALFIRNSARVSVTNNMMHDVFRGVAVFDSDDVTIRRNIITGVGADGVVGRGVVRFKVLENYFADFALVDPVQQHPDAIQIWTRGAFRASRDVEIAGNIVRRGAGDPSQGILISGSEYTTTDIMIERNIIEQSMGQGIALSNISNAIIRNNSVLPFDYVGDAPAIDIRSPMGNVSVNANLAMAYRLDPAVGAADNVKPDYFNPWTPAFVVNYIVDPAAPFAPADFEALTLAGAHGIVRDLWLGDPNAPDRSLTPPPVIVDFDFARTPVDRAPNPVQIAPATDKYGASYFSTDVSPKLTAALSLMIEARCRLPSTAVGYRYVASVSSSYNLRVDRDHIIFSVWTASGVTRLDARAPVMLDLAAHDLTAAYDGIAGVMTVYVDGREIARRAAPTGPIAYYPSYRLFAGGAPWGGSFDGGVETLKISR